MTVHPYDHLTTSIAQTRYAMAANFLNDCRLVLEIGGSRYCSIDSFMTDERERVLVVGNDILDMEVWEDGVRYFNNSVEDFPFGQHLNGYNEGNIGLCILGLELLPKQPDTDPLAVLISEIHRFDKVVIDYVTTNELASRQSIILSGALQAADIELVIDMVFEWQFDRKYFVTKEAQGLEPSPSFFRQRRLMVFER